MKALQAALWRWLDERFALAALVAWARAKQVPIHRGSVFYYIGGACVFFFLIQLASGILLLMYYRVGADASYESVQYISSKVAFGWLVRSVHSWGANLMILFAFIHMISVFFMRAYRKPRELTWLTGCALLVICMLFGFSGYLLPWNELAFFATRVGTDIVGQVPLAGGWLLKLIRGGEDVTGATLSRFFGLHVAILPALLVLLMTAHLAFVQIQGMSHEKTAPRRIPFFPNFLLRDMIFWLAILNVIGVLAVFFPWEVGKKADLLASAPAGIKPEWYFLPQYQFLKILPARILLIPGELWGIACVNAAGAAWFLLPFWESALRENKRERILNVGGAAALLAFIVMTLWGYLS